MTEGKGERTAPAEALVPSGWSAADLATSNPISDQMLTDINESAADLPFQSAADIFWQTGFRLIGRAEMPEGSGFRALLELHQHLAEKHTGYRLLDLPYVDEEYGSVYGVFRDEEADHLGRVSFNPVQREKWVRINGGVLYELDEI